MLFRSRSETVKDEATREWRRTEEMIDPAAENYELQPPDSGKNQDD